MSDDKDVKPAVGTDGEASSQAFWEAFSEGYRRAVDRERVIAEVAGLLRDLDDDQVAVVRAIMEQMKGVGGDTWRVRKIKADLSASPDDRAAPMPAEALADLIDRATYRRVPLDDFRQALRLLKEDVNAHREGILQHCFVDLR